jgi:acetylornithine/succinyldiaminopimelate/putrescine aminotransferase
VIVNATDDRTIRLAPPLIITAEEIDHAGDVMRQAQH